MTVTEREPVLESKPKDEPHAAPVTQKEELPEEIEQAQKAPLAEKTYPAWSTALTLLGLVALGTILLFYIL